MPLKRINACPVCKNVPKLGYACGEYFIAGTDGNCTGCGTNGFGVMHSSPDLEIEEWNNWSGSYEEAPLNNNVF